MPALYNTNTNSQSSGAAVLPGAAGDGEAFSWNPGGSPAIVEGPGEGGRGGEGGDGAGQGEHRAEVRPNRQGAGLATDWRVCITICFSSSLYTCTVPCYQLTFDADLFLVGPRVPLQVAGAAAVVPRLFPPDALQHQAGPADQDPALQVLLHLPPVLQPLQLVHSGVRLDLALEKHVLALVYDLRVEGETKSEVQAGWILKFCISVFFIIKL